MKTWTVEEIKNLLATNDKVCLTSLLKIYECQTDEEQYSGETHESNGVGFNGVDAPILSSFCEFYRRTGFVTAKQMNIIRKKIMKYAKQITSLANEHEMRKTA